MQDFFQDLMARHLTLYRTTAPKSNFLLSDNVGWFEQKGSASVRALTKGLKGELRYNYIYPLTPEVTMSSTLTALSPFRTSPPLTLSWNTILRCHGLSKAHCGRHHSNLCKMKYGSLVI